MEQRMRKLENRLLILDDCYSMLGLSFERFDDIFLYLLHSFSLLLSEVRMYSTLSHELCWMMMMLDDGFPVFFLVPFHSHGA